MSTFAVERKVCEITYIKRGGDTTVREVDPNTVERRRNGDIVFKYWDPERGFTSVWVSKRFLLNVTYKTIQDKVEVD